MSSEEQELLAKIGQLAGKINRHKSQKAAAGPLAAHQPSHHRSNAYRRGSQQQQQQFRVGRPPAPHRHRTLVMNHGGTQTPTSDNAQSSDASSSWVSKTSRHRQLINSAIYEKDNQSRVKAIEATRQQQITGQNAREKAQLAKHLQHSGGGHGVASVPTKSSSAGTHEIDIQGIRFRVVKDGSKLVKVSGALHPPSDTPKTALVGGVKFHRSRNGNLYRDGVLKAQRQSGVTKVTEPCRMFSSTGTCTKGPMCRYIHDASRVAVCRDFLQKGKCPNGQDCDLSHDLTPQRTPTCLHYSKGNCANPDCPYAHSDVSPAALVCRAFGIYGYCELGEKCTDRHVSECPDFSNTGKCKTKGCKLLHRERASVLRKSEQRPGSADDEADDLSSDDESTNSDDVDSDEVDEFLGRGAPDDSEFKVQRDFIAF